ncbi:putative F-box domain-containing protein [Helianthus annuus]|uniref:F-box domain-containing protein n=1 Tax=Helianthus annuus TaxID=4232 RepID=A0A9K3DI57_HELAN|nr:F-box protein At1g49990 [Helianthus annuus]KAF5755074.1 putative F-box domain-containing protein [Helianthus annuus]
MEDDNPPNHLHNQTQITHPKNKKQNTQSQTLSQITNPISNTSVLGLVLLAHTFTYDLTNFPESLLLEIISRLPLKSIFKFKCVCKHWLTLISQPSFSKFYFNVTANSASSSVQFRILYRYIYVSKFKDVLDRFRPEVYNSHKFSVLFLSSFEEQQQSDQFKVLGVSNGLILCCLLGPLVYYVCDPVTRQWVTLPRGRDMSASTHPIFFGEGFVSRVDENNVVVGYTVVRVELLSLRTNYLSLEAFSSETGKWVDYKLPCESPIALMKRGGGPVCFNGNFHWFVYDHGMVAFDPNKEPKSCRLIQFPEDREVETEYKHDGLYRLCDECQGKLRFFEVAYDVCSFYCFSMWDMKDYEKGEWCSEFKVTRSDLSSSDPELNGWLMKAKFLPLSFHPFDLDIVYLRCVELACVVSYSIRNKTLDVVAKPIGVVDDLSWRVVIPFVIPKWPTPVPIPPVPKKVVKPRGAHRLRSCRIHTRF